MAGLCEGGNEPPGYLKASDNAGEMNLGSSTESYPAFARIELRENPGKNLNQVTCPDWDSNPGHLVSRPDALTVTPKVWTINFLCKLGNILSRTSRALFEKRRNGMRTGYASVVLLSVEMWTPQHKMQCVLIFSDMANHLSTEIGSFVAMVWFKIMKLERTSRIHAEQEEYKEKEAHKRRIGLHGEQGSRRKTREYKKNKGVQSEQEEYKENNKRARGIQGEQGEQNENKVTWKMRSD
ncbi:hypothetical protein ANN_18044 [Periplaneta americana]|uniref:Uncharacterized protein n=1 Tax=Periplaneta americana TaxID=6978 RepID=A0ABQ8SMM4_PERAM|nr:hypothetical protein ANN_18044 [Periplaneta americana]